MAVQILSLKSTQLSNVSQTMIYTSPASPVALTTIVKNIRLVNTSGSTVTINLYFAPSGGSARRIGPQNMSIAANALAIDDQEVTMGPGDQILGDASANNVVDVVISGIQR